MALWQRCTVHYCKALRGLRAIGCHRVRRCRSLSTRSGLDAIYDKIRAGGPVTVAEYMRECLLHPVTGYYMQKDVFGAKGDFITSPEISQVFGELLAVWVLADWMSVGEPSGCQLVELGPGRGTLTKDMLRVFGQFGLSQKALSVHCVEASPALSAIQEQTLRNTSTANSDVVAITADTMSSSVPYKSCALDSGVQVSWYQRVEDVPKGHSYYIAHEFFDALPVHQFQNTPSGWREVLVDIDPAASSKALRFVLAPSPTPASATYSGLLPEGEQGEVCPEGLVMVKEIARRVREEGGGTALIADYGEEGVRRHTLRGFKQHQLHDVLVEPGTADLTADVDFATVKKATISEGAGCFGPMTQNEFLHKMGIRQRMEVLLKRTTPSQARGLLSSYEMLTSPEKMGHRFKFMAISTSPEHIPNPFTEPES